MRRPAAFLDRDGTLNRRPARHDYLRSADAFVWLPGAREGAARLAKAGYALFVVSNQRGVARGLLTEAVLSAIEERIQAGLAAEGCRVEAFRYCVHDLSAACSCRKPRPGLLVDLAGEKELDLARSWMIGDSDTDVLAGQAAGCRTALVTSSPVHSQPDVVAASLLEASEVIAETCERAA